MELIDKSALIAEIEKMKNRAHPNSEWNHGYVASCEKILSFLDTLEVKEVDLSEEFDKYCSNLYLIDFENEPYAELFECAKYFFNLGLKQKGG